MACITSGERAVFEQTEVEKAGMYLCIGEINILKDTSGKVTCSKLDLGKIDINKTGIGDYDITMTMRIVDGGDQRLKDSLTILGMMKTGISVLQRISFATFDRTGHAFEHDKSLSNHLSHVKLLLACTVG